MHTTMRRIKPLIFAIILLWETLFFWYKILQASPVVSICALITKIKLKCNKTVMLTSRDIGWVPMAPDDRPDKPGNIEELLPGEPGELSAPTPIPIVEPPNPGLRLEL